MSRRIKEHPPAVSSRLVRGTRSADCDRSGLRCIQIVDSKLKVELLGGVADGPVRRAVCFYALHREPDPRPLERDEVVGLDGDFEVEQLAVEARQTYRIKCVEGDSCQSRQCSHRRTIQRTV